MTPANPPPPEAHRHGRNAGWRHVDANDILAMPDPWEYPWFAAWDLAFHAIAWAHLDPAFAKYQLLVLLREWYLHPNGALPAYEWSFDDVNPPVHAVRRAAGLRRRRRRRPRPSSSGSSTSCCSTTCGGSTGRTPTATTSSAAASSGSTTSAPSTGRTSRPERRWCRPTARRGWPSTRLSMLAIGAAAGRTRSGVRRPGGHLPRAVHVHRAGHQLARASTTPTAASSTTSSTAPPAGTGRRSRPSAAPSRSSPR